MARLPRARNISVGSASSRPPILTPRSSGAPSLPGRPPFLSRFDRCRSTARMSESPVLPISEIERVFREEYGRAVAVLVRVFRDISIAEEAVQDAFTTAVQRWPSTGLPPSPAGWIITTARNRAIDRLRREASREDRHAQAALLHAPGEPYEESDEDVVRDDQLRLIFTCCHPALAPAVRV